MASSAIEEKSLGAIAKGGTGTAQDVCEYGMRPRGKGLGLVDGPGQDSKSLTSFAAAGVTVCFFSTGRGSPIGFFDEAVAVASGKLTRLRNWAWSISPAFGPLARRCRK